MPVDIELAGFALTESARKRQALERHRQEIQTDLMEQEVAAGKRKAEDEIRSSLLGKFAGFSAGQLMGPKVDFVGPSKPLGSGLRWEDLPPDELAIIRERGWAIDKGDGVFDVDLAHPEIMSAGQNLYAAMAGAEAKTAEAKKSAMTDAFTMEAAELLEMGKPKEAMDRFDLAMVSAGKDSPLEREAGRQLLQAGIELRPMLVEMARTGQFKDADGNIMDVASVDVPGLQYRLAEGATRGESPEAVARKGLLDATENVGKIKEQLAVEKKDANKLGILNGYKAGVQNFLAVLAVTDPSALSIIASKFSLPLLGVPEGRQVETIADYWTRWHFPEMYGERPPGYVAQAIAGVKDWLSKPRRAPGTSDPRVMRERSDRILGRK